MGIATQIDDALNPSILGFWATPAEKYDFDELHVATTIMGRRKMMQSLVL